MKFNIRDLLNELAPEEYGNIEIENSMEIDSSLDNIRQGVLERINKEGPSSKEKKRKVFKRPIRGLWTAALIICLTATTVFAFNTNLDFFKGIFGTKIEKMEEDIQDIIATTENKDFIFTVESVLTDGSQNYFIVSLERKDGEDIGEIEPYMDAEIIRKNPEEKPKGFGGVSVFGIDKIETKETHKNKGYYLFSYNTSDNIIGEKIEIILSGTYEESRAPEDVSAFDEDLKVSFHIEDNGTLRTLDIEEPQLLKEKYYITEVKYSNLGMNIMGEYIEDTNIIPGVRIRFKYKDGSIKEVIRPYQGYSEEFGFSYSRRGDSFKNMIIFKAPIYFDEIQSIIMEDKEYKIE